MWPVVQQLKGASDATAQCLQSSVQELNELQASFKEECERRFADVRELTTSLDHKISKLAYEIEEQNSEDRQDSHFVLVRSRFLESSYTPSCCVRLKLQLLHWLRNLQGRCICSSSDFKPCSVQGMMSSDELNSVRFLYVSFVQILLSLVDRNQSRFVCVRSCACACCLVSVRLRARARCACSLTVRFHFLVLPD